MFVRAGTGPGYLGLYEGARALAPQTAAELERAEGEFPERAKVPAFVEMMVRVDGHWNRLKAIQKAEFKTPADHPDLDPPHEALQLTELFREASRLSEVRARGEAFVRKMRDDEMSHRRNYFDTGKYILLRICLLYLPAQGTNRPHLL